MSQFALHSPTISDAHDSHSAPTNVGGRYPLSLFNSLTKRLEIFTPIESNKVRMYTCGLTVNDVMHLGHARAYIMWDVLKRYLEYLGYEVFHVSNVTDISVDDKLLSRIEESGESFQQHVSRYTLFYFEDRLRLGIAPADIHPLATQHIQEMIELVQRLLEKGYAYQAEDGIYFRISRFEDYGKLSGIAKDRLEPGSSGRVSKDEYSKEEVGDFVLWKRSRPGEPYWHSPWGPGRPGWHIECSAMAMKYLGESFDIHCGGEEHLFPHHENEIAQSEALTNKPLAKYWLHLRHLLQDGRKMSKSTREFVSVRDAAQQYGPLAIRILLLSTHYRKTMSLDEHTYHTATEHADKLSSLWATVRYFSTKGPTSPTLNEDRLLLQLDTARSTFEGALSHNLNTPLALSALLGLARETATHANTHAEISGHTALMIQRFLDSAGTVLFGDLATSELQQEQDSVFGDLVELILRQRDRLRAEGRYDEADSLRRKLEQLGIVLQDVSGSTIWRRTHLMSRESRD